MEPVRLAVVGVGVIGKKHVSTILDESQAKLVAVADPVSPRGIVERLDGVQCFDEASAMLDAVRPEGVVVATPTAHHVAPALEALDAGAHVLIEKPITSSLAEARTIIAKSHQTGLQVLVGHHRRYYPLVQRAAEIVRGGAIGDLIAVSGQWTALKPNSYFAPAWRRKRAAGPVLTNVIHELDSLRVICGEMTHLYAETASQVRGHDKEETAAIIMRFENGALGTFLLSDATPSPWAWEFATGENPAFPPSHQNTHRFTGVHGALEFPELVVWRQEAGELGWNHPIHRDVLTFERVDAFAEQCKHFCAVVRGVEPPRITAEDATRTLAATLAVFDAAQSGRRVAL